MVKLWLSTATTRYFSSKIFPMAAFINELDAVSREHDSGFF
jgi:hypothetical protein